MVTSPAHIQGGLGCIVFNRQNSSETIQANKKKYLGNVICLGICMYNVIVKRDNNIISHPTVDCGRLISLQNIVTYLFIKHLLNIILI